MEELIVSSHNGYNGRSLTLRDVLTVAFRHRRLMLLSFLGILSGAILTTIMQPNRYNAVMKILVKRNRVDPIVTPDAAAVTQSGEVTEEDLNSEVELLKGRGLLEKVVLACDLQQYQKNRTVTGILTGMLPRNGNFFRDVSTPSSLNRSGASQTPEVDARVASAVRALEKKLKVEVVKKTDLIAVNYESPDPQLAARVLTTLANLYLEKHVAVHHSAGAFDFFQQETERYREELTKAEARLVDFDRRKGVVSAALEKEVALQKLAEFEVTLRQTYAAIADTQQRIHVLEREAAVTPTRMVTQVRNTDDGALLSQIRTNLLALEQKRTELLGKFEPTYRPVQELEAQIAQTRAALASAQKSQLHEETTDRDPTYEWGRGELAKAKADLVGLQARAQTIALTVQSYQESARSLEQKGIVQDSLIRAVKEAQDNYALYLRKEEEARISDALDRGRILNVAIAEAPTVPSLPSNHRSTTMLLGVLLAVFISFGLVFVSERLDSTFRTPDEIGLILDIPVLAAIPQRAKNGAPAHVS